LTGYGGAGTRKELLQNGKVHMMINSY